MLIHFQTLNIGWAKGISQKVNEYNLEQDWDKVKTLTSSTWKRVVNVAVKTKNRQKLLNNCIQQEPDDNKMKMKTAYVYKNLNNGANSRL